MSRGAGEQVGFVDLPLDIGGAVKGFTGKRGVRENIVDAMIESKRVLRRTAAAMAAAALVFGVDG
jgi:hypothetical protein